MMKMMRMMKSDRLQSIGVAGAIRACALLCAFMVLPLAAWADDDDKPVPIDPQTAAAQNWAIGIVLGLVCLSVIWYNLRRWQILRSGNQVHGDSRHQD